MITQPTAQLPMIASGNSMPFGYASSGASNVGMMNNGMMNNIMGGLNMSNNAQGSWSITQPPNQMQQSNTPAFLPGGDARSSFNHSQGYGLVPNAGAGDSSMQGMQGFQGMQGSLLAAQQMQASQMQASQIHASRMQQAAALNQLQTFQRLAAFNQVRSFLSLSQTHTKTHTNYVTTKSILIVSLPIDAMPFYLPMHLYVSIPSWIFIQQHHHPCHDQTNRCRISRRVWDRCTRHLTENLSDVKYVLHGAMPGAMPGARP